MSNTGKVRSVDKYVKYDDKGHLKLIKGRPIKTYIINSGYEVVGLRNGRTKNCKHFLVHRIVAKVFVPNPLNYPQVNHIDECKTSNNAANLEWCDQEYNNVCGTKIDRTAKTQGKIVQQFTLDGTLVAEYWGAKEAARQTGFGQGNISTCCRGEYKQAYGYVWKYKEGA